MPVLILRRPPGFCIAALLGLLSLLISGVVAHAAEPPSFFAGEAGLPPLRIYSPADYGGSYQTWTMTNGPDCLVYIGDFGGLLEFDGAKWRRLAPTGIGSVRYLAQLDDQKLYLTANNDFGYAVRDSTGELRYTSLKSEIPAEFLPLGAIIALARHGDALYLGTEKGVMRWQPGRTRIWPAAPGAGRASLYPVGTQLWRRDARASVISELRGEEWVPILDAPELLNRAAPFFVLGSDGVPIVAINQLGLFRLVGGRLVPWSHAAAALLDRARVMSAVLLRDGTLVVTTLSEGVVLISADGQRARQLRMPEGLPSNLVVSADLDADGRLWLCTYNGIAVLDWPAPLTLFDRRAGFDPSTVSMLQRTPEGLVVGGLGGRFKVAPAAPTAFAPATLVRQPGSDLITSSPIEHAAGRLIPTSDGIKVLRGEQSELVCPINDILLTLTASKLVPGRVYFGSEKGLGSALWRGGQWRVEGYAPKGPHSVRTIVEDTDGTLWARSLTHDAWHLTPPPPDGDWQQATGQPLTAIPGWPGGTYENEETALGIIFSAGGKFLRYDRVGHRFVDEDRVDRASGPSGQMDIKWVDAAGRIWATSYAEGMAAGRRHGFGYYATDGDGPRHRWHALSPEISAAIGSFGIESASADGVDPNIIWLRGTQGVGRLDTSLARELSLPPAPRLRRVALDRVPQSLAGPVRLPSMRAPLRFEFAPGGGTLAEARFETRLVGWNAEWTTPAAATDATFTGLGAGNYAFEVRERAPGGSASAITRFPFAIAPPWHLSPVAYALYTLALAAAIYGYVRSRLARAERERVRLEALVAARTRDLAIARDAAESANRAKSAFLASMSHELRTPLNGVLGYAQLLQGDKRLAPDQQEQLRIVHQSGEHLLHMINEVLDLAKIEAGKLALRPAPFALNDLLRDIAAAHAHAAHEKRLSFTIAVAPDLPAWVTADAQKLRQILDNLLGNAIKFTPTGSVTLRVSQSSPGVVNSALTAEPRLPLNDAAPAPPDQRITFAVADTGPGISAADQTRLFQAFEQAEPNHLAPTTGTGLGLAISRALVERFGGRLTLESTPGRGSTFAFTLALPTAAPGVPATAAGRRIVGYTGRPLRALIIDDHAVNRRLLCDLLNPLGFDCADYASPATALDRVTAGAEPWPDVAILDLRMPEIDGLDLTRRLRALPRGTELKILLTSASVIAFDPASATRAGCDGFLPKPFRSADLLETLGRLLGVTWRESDSAAPFPVHPIPGVPLPASARAALRECLATGDLGAFTAALGQLRATDPASEAALAELAAAASSFQLARLRQLLE